MYSDQDIAEKTEELVEQCRDFLDDQFRFRTTIKSQEWDLVCYGHTHVAEQHLEGHTLVLNPGAIYRANPRSIALVTLPALEVEFINLD